jgi:translation elongation factor EF-1beta
MLTYQLQNTAFLFLLNDGKLKAYGSKLLLKITVLKTRLIKPISFGRNSISFGLKAISFGRNSISFGLKATSFGRNSISFGLKAISFGRNSISFGLKPISFGHNSISFGKRWQPLCRILRLSG